jgi:hypothetical protein
MPRCIRLALDSSHSLTTVIDSHLHFYIYTHFKSQSSAILLVFCILNLCYQHILPLKMTHKDPFDDVLHKLDLYQRI